MGNLKKLTETAKLFMNAKDDKQVEFGKGMKHILDIFNEASYVNKMDWEMLRAQKLSLLQIIEKLRGMKDNERADDLTGILHLIDALQDFAVDELEISSTIVFDFEAEENRDD